MSRIIIADPHGCYKTLVALMAKLPPDVPITFAGDLIDRGPDSRSVVELVKRGGYDCVVGNHEVMMLEDLRFEDGEYVSPSFSSTWGYNGGDQCLDSYVLENGNMSTALKEHYDWIKTLPYFLEYQDLKDSEGRHLLVTHTTASLVWKLGDRDGQPFKKSVTWDRVRVPKKIDGIFNVYGHTPQQVKATIGKHYACIDTGACYKNPGYGKLTALQWPEMVLFEQGYVE